MNQCPKYSTFYFNHMSTETRSEIHLLLKTDLTRSKKQWFNAVFKILDIFFPKETMNYKNNLECIFKQSLNNEIAMKNKNPRLLWGLNFCAPTWSSLLSSGQASRPCGHKKSKREFAFFRAPTWARTRDQKIMSLLL